MKMFTPERIEKARQAKTIEELIAIAVEEGVELSAEEAAAYFARLNSASGELSDSELDNVSGGSCAGDTRGDHVQLPGGICPYCGAKDPSGYYDYRGGHYGFSYYMERLDCCGNTMNLGHSELERLVKLG